MLLKEVHITGFWDKYDLDWKLNETVNILSGINGAGKTTLLEVIHALMKSPEADKEVLLKINQAHLVFTQGYVIEYDGKSIQYKQEGKEISFQEYNDNIRIGAVSTFDSTLPTMEEYQKYILSKSGKIRSGLDWAVERLLELYYRYVNGISQEVENAIKRNNLVDLFKYYEKKNEFLKLINALFKSTHKTIFESEEGIQFKLEDGKAIPAKELSSGEKQLLILTIHALLQKNQEFVTFWDEPEISLHIDWQRMLIRTIRTLNPNGQLIISTHSPSIIYEGWEKMVVNMEDLLK